MPSGLSKDEIGLDLIQRTPSPATETPAAVGGGFLDRQPGTTQLGLQGQGPVAGNGLDRINAPGAFTTSGADWGEKPSSTPAWGSPEAPQADKLEMASSHAPSREQGLDPSGPSKDAAPGKSLSTEMNNGGPAVAGQDLPASQPPGMGTQILEWAKANPMATAAIAGTALAGGSMLLGGGSMLSNLGTAAKIMMGVMLLGGLASALMPKKNEKAEKPKEKEGVVPAIGKAALLGSILPGLGVMKLGSALSDQNAEKKG